MEGRECRKYPGVEVRGKDKVAASFSPGVLERNRAILFRVICRIYKSEECQVFGTPEFRDASFFLPKSPYRVIY